MDKDNQEKLFNLLEEYQGEYCKEYLHNEKGKRPCIGCRYDVEENDSSQWCMLGRAKMLIKLDED